MEMFVWRMVSVLVQSLIWYARSIPFLPENNSSRRAFGEIDSDLKI